MFSVNSTIKLNMDVIRNLEKTAQIALEHTTMMLSSEVQNAQVIPFDKGQLKDSTVPDYTNSAKGQTGIVSDTPYARRLYFHPEYNFHREVWYDKQGREHGANESAGAKWFRNWQKGGTRENFCVDTFAEIYRGLNRL